MNADTVPSPSKFGQPRKAPNEEGLVWLNGRWMVPGQAERTRARWRARQRVRNRGFEVTPEAYAAELAKEEDPFEPAVRAYLAGEGTAEQLAERFGVTANGIGRRCSGEGKRVATLLRRARMAEERAVLAEVRGVQRLLSDGSRCPVCWGPVPEGRVRTCCEWCRKAWSLVRDQLDPEEWAKHRRQLAQGVIRRGERGQVHARNVLAGTVDEAWSAPRRHPVPGSARSGLLAEVLRRREGNVRSFGRP